MKRRPTKRKRGDSGLGLADGITAEGFRLQARQSTWHKQELFKGKTSSADSLHNECLIWYN